VNPNVLICGQTGAGKSSVINFVLKKDIAQTALGASCTRGINRIEGEKLNFYDSEGYEIGNKEKAERYKSLLNSLFAEKKGVDEAVHQVWYAISGAGKRYTGYDIEIVQMIADMGVPVCILLTKIDELDKEELFEVYGKLQCDFAMQKIFAVSKEAHVQAFCEWKGLFFWTFAKFDAVDPQRIWRQSDTPRNFFSMRKW
jgi:GTP-binding protein EngB required for normal cell division